MSDYYIGLMSGTSLDSVDGALVEFNEATPRCIAFTGSPIEPGFKSQLLALCEPDAQLTLAQLTQLDVEFARLSAEVVKRLLTLTQIPANKIRAIGSHGQTIFHQPSGTTPTSLQIGDPNIIAEETGITTVADFRRRDLAAGGQGAPLVPAFHKQVFSSEKTNRVVLNIGGIANITVLRNSSLHPVIGFDTGPGNLLMDAWITRHKGERFDNNGDWAAQGTINQGFLADLISDPYFTLAPPKSTGREYFNLDWLDSHLTDHGHSISPINVQTTLSELTARSIADAINTHAAATQTIIVCGGGVHNTTLLNRLKTLGNWSLRSSAEYGLQPDWVEAIAFAWLARQTIANHAGNLPSVTGARHPLVLGGIYPGALNDT